MTGMQVQGNLTIDPISLEIIWNRLVSIADEAAIALVRTSFSTVVRESNDYACAVLDSNGDSVAENSLGVPAFVGIMSVVMKHLLAALPMRGNNWRPGDVAITNDPWLATGHLLDAALASPIFHEGRLVAFYVSIAHMSDVGGLGRTADGRSVYEEGVRIPPMWLQKEGELNESLVSLLRANVRVPDEVVGDLLARLATGSICARRLDEFLSEQGLDDLSAVSRALQERAEISMRRAIEKLPDGTYRHEVVADGYETPLLIRVAITVNGSDVVVDYAGSSPEQDRGLNSVMNYTWAETVYPIKCALDPLTPKNEGSYRPIKVLAPEGSVVNPRFPAPVTARQQIGHFLSQAVFGALAQVIPHKVMAESGSCPTYRVVITGYRGDRTAFAANLFAAGGTGARCGLDGLHCIAFPGNTGLGSLEAIESVSPLRFKWKRLLPDSGGPGQYRGGSGQHIAVTVDSPNPSTLSVTADRVSHPAHGLAGGLPGSPAGVYLNEGEYLHPKARTVIPPGGVMHFLYPGGGGYGNPTMRENSRLLRDLQDGIVTPRAAREHYGAVPPEGTEE